MLTSVAKNTSMDRPIVIRMGALGDMVMLTPLLQTIYQQTGMAADVVVCGEWNRVLFANSPWVNNLYAVSSRNRPYWFNRSKQQLVSTLKNTASQRPWFMLEHLPTIYRLLKRAHFQETNGILARDHVRQIGEHTCAQFMRMAKTEYPMLETPPLDKITTQLTVSAQQITECETWLASKHINPQQHNIILIQAGNKKTMRKGKRDRDSNIKYWAEKNWAELLLTIAATDENIRVLLCGAPSEVDLCNDILALCQEQDSARHIMQVADDLPLSRLMALASLAHSCVSVDTGPAHIAAAVGCPLVVLFGKSDPRQFRPLGKNDVQVVTTSDWQSFNGTPAEWAEKNHMEAIKIENVLQTWKNLTPKPIDNSFGRPEKTLYQ